MLYDRRFYEAQQDVSLASARVILPLVTAITPTTTVVDLGCGVGSWLQAATELGTISVTGIDGDYVSVNELRISAASFVAANLERPLPQLSARVDLAICVEVLEHISAPAGERAVEWLCHAAPVVLFSAALPGQGGKNHINENWLSHWVERFEQHDFLPYDLIRPRLWRDQRVDACYRQNIIIFAERGHPPLARQPPAPLVSIDVVHPEIFAYHVGRERHFESARLKERIRRLTRSARLGQS